MKLLLCSIVVAMAFGGCGGKDGKPYGDPCTKPDDCASGLCGGPDQRPQTCDCADTSDCPSGLVCQHTIDIGNRCYPAPDAAVSGP